jgi:hypothetical protein
MKLVSLFLWLLMPLGLWIAVSLYGAPHLVVSYRFHDNGSPYNLRIARHYISCTWVGLSGVITLPAQEGHCPWVRLIKRVR